MRFRDVWMYGRTEMWVKGRLRSVDQWREDEGSFRICQAGAESVHTPCSLALSSSLMVRRATCRYVSQTYMWTSRQTIVLPLKPIPLCPQPWRHIARSSCTPNPSAQSLLPAHVPHSRLTARRVLFSTLLDALRDSLLASATSVVSAIVPGQDPSGSQLPDMTQRPRRI